ncbi:MULTISPECIES: accessory factor UbiK family protein [Hyphobacterium]|uniref:Accessory factor UbiK family protein n=1 Tax=Hyphobacterium vulgare TaxID=1736751 RepID=A0ABV6ZZG8_9PROT
MQTRNPLLNDFAELMSDAFAAAQAAGDEAKTAFKAQMRRALAEMDLVEREEFEAVKEMAARARAEAEALARRVEALEGGQKPAGKPGAKAAAKTAKPAARTRPRAATRNPPARKAAKPKKD